MALPTRLIAVLVVSWAGSAAAHTFDHPKTIQLGVRAREVVLSIAFDVNPGEDARLLRGLFDRNADRTLDEAEQAALAQYLEKTALLFLELHIDGTRVVLVKKEASPHRVGNDATASQSLGISLLYSVPLPASAKRGVTLLLADHDRDPQRHVPTVVDLDASWFIVFASQGEYHPNTRQLHRIRLAENVPLRLELRPQRAD